MHHSKIYYHHRPLKEEFPDIHQSLSQGLFLRLQNYRDFQKTNHHQPHLTKKIQIFQVILVRENFQNLVSFLHSHRQEEEAFYSPETPGLYSTPCRYHIYLSIGRIRLRNWCKRRQSPSPLPTRTFYRTQVEFGERIGLVPDHKRGHYRNCYCCHFLSLIVFLFVSFSREILWEWRTGLGVRHRRHHSQIHHFSSGNLTISLVSLLEGRL
mmetsp:Transcript_29520/g.62665  ORF Transcript_29520/g.62665 Transcript_29520/m.62665 type:complete len:210 (-) Transcript_29520:194-823(-)